MAVFTTTSTAENKEPAKPQIKVIEAFNDDQSASSYAHEPNDCLPPYQTNTWWASNLSLSVIYRNSHEGFGREHFLRDVEEFAEKMLADFTITSGMAKRLGYKSSSIKFRHYRATSDGFVH